MGISTIGALVAATEQFAVPVGETMDAGPAPLASVEMRFALNVDVEAPPGARGCVVTKMWTPAGIPLNLARRRVACDATPAPGSSTVVSINPLSVLYVTP